MAIFSPGLNPSAAELGGGSGFNPGRNGAAVREIAEAYGAAKTSASLRWFLKLAQRLSWWDKSLKGTMEQYNPALIQRLRALETMLKTEMRPDSVVVHLKPIQYLDTPQGYGFAKLHRYRLSVQTLVDPSPTDALEAVSIQLTATADPAEVVVDAITPQPGFSVVGLKKTSGAQIGTQETVSDKQTVAGEIGGGGAKISGGLESAHSVQESTLIIIA